MEGAEGWRRKRTHRAALCQSFASGATDELAEFIREDIVDHSAPAGATPGRQGLAEVVEFYQSCFSDLDITADEVLEVGDRVVAYGTITGTHTGPWLNLLPSGKR